MNPQQIHTDGATLLWSLVLIRQPEPAISPLDRAAPELREMVCCSGTGVMRHVVPNP